MVPTGESRSDVECGDLSPLWFDCDLSQSALSLFYAECGDSRRRLKRRQAAALHNNLSLADGSDGASVISGKLNLTAADDIQITDHAVV